MPRTAAEIMKYQRFPGAAGNSAAPGFCAGKPGVFSAARGRKNKYELSINNIEKALDFPPARV